MKKIFGHIELKSISAILFAVFIFAFIHSELGQFTPKGDKHNFHDYCQIVDVATTPITRPVSTNIFKLQVSKDVCLHCANCDGESTESVAVNSLENPIRPHSSTEIYLHNNSFLI